MAISRKLKKVHVGLSIMRDRVDVSVFNPKSFDLKEIHSAPLPNGIFSGDHEAIQDVQGLKNVVSGLLNQLQERPKIVNLSVPATLLRMVEMPRMEEEQLYLSLSSEAERYKSFDGTEAVVDFAVLESGSTSSNMLQIVLGALREDSLKTIIKLFKELKVKINAVDLEDLNVFRGMAGSGALDSLVQQIGENAHWGTVFVQSNHVRFSLWQGNRLVELRETQMETSEFQTAKPESIFVEDMIEEIRRTSKNYSPVIWLTYRMPEAMSSILESRANVPFRPCVLGPAVDGAGNASMSVVGASLISTVSFPFVFDVMNGLGKGIGSSASGGDSSAEISEEAESKAAMLMTTGGGLLAVSVVIAGLLFGINALWANAEAAKEKAKMEAAQNEVNQLNRKIAALKNDSDISNVLARTAVDAKIRNKVMVELTNDLRIKAPAKLWIDLINIKKSTISISGIAHQQQDVLDFAKSFDTVPYLKYVKIDYINEEKIEELPVFDYSINAGINMNKKLLDEATIPVPLEDVN